MVSLLISQTIVCLDHPHLHSVFEGTRAMRHRPKTSRPKVSLTTKQKINNRWKAKRKKIRKAKYGI
ncbi:hypothetical protein Plim_2301 [Planctopirus limnophila DSM 3776]|uniref:Uncharacterized protein n=2 Tax=Planctopirus TaxID=1649480 RepID=D5SNL3_PLAL2|nr:hypothetical protein Plim_2301 [Planctopirus limnophila DSM 3776]